jgi:hypothetical protein
MSSEERKKVGNTIQIRKQRFKDSFRYTTKV